jgi:tetratricopeptide (TPR) repeat protein
VTSRLATSDDLFAIMEQIAEERAAAKPIVQSVLERGEQVWDEEIPASWRTAGFVQELTAAAAGILESDPPRSLSFAQLALAVASSIPAERYPPPVQAHLEGRAWKEIGTAHRYLDAYDAALRAYTAAYRSLARENVLSHDQGCVQLVRAGLLVLTRDDESALEFIAQSETVFREHGDQERLEQAKFIKGLIHHYRGELHRARIVYEDILTRVANGGDLHTLAMLHHNLGHIHTVLGDASTAVSYFCRARDIFTELNMPGEVDRVGWGLAFVLLSTGEFEKALSLLGPLREAYLQRQCPEEAGLIALYMVDALIALDRLEAARSLSELVLKEFVIAKLNARAVTALAYLREFLPKSKQPRRAVRHVRSYIERLHSEPTRLFVPLADQ